MSSGQRLVPAGRVGRPHGNDGSFHVDRPQATLEPGTTVTVAGREARIERRAGTPERPLLRLSGVGDRDAAAALRGEKLLVAEADAPLGEGEWLAEDLVGCRIEGIGEVRRVVSGPSCDVLEVGEDGFLVPFLSDAIRSIDTAAGTIEVDRRFLGLAPPRPEPEAGPTAERRGAR